MSAPVLAVTVPPALGSVLSAALSTHPDLVVRDGARVQELRARLDEHTRSRVQSDRMPWDHGTDWVSALVDREVARFAHHAGARHAVWPAQEAESASATARALDARVATWIAGPGHAVAATGEDPIAAAAAAGERWARSRAAALELDGVDVTREPGSVLTALGLAWNETTATALGMLRTLPSPALPPAVLGALGAHPDVAAALGREGVDVPPPPRHPAVLVVRAAAAPDTAERVLLARQVLNTEPSAAVRARAVDLLIESGEHAVARAELVRWMRADDAPEAWTRLLTNTTGRPESRWLRRARLHRDPTVRGALARWLVTEGLDAQAAETVCAVRDTGWFRTSAPTRA